MRKLALVMLLGSSSLMLRADFTYQETTQMTGGSLMTMMRALGPLAGRMKEPIVSTHLIKGNRMATITRDNVTIFDLDKETVTTIDNAKKTYSVTTFAEMKQRMEEAAKKAQSRKGNEDVKANVKVSAKATGKTRAIQGLNAKEMLITMTMEGTNTKSGESGGMDIETDAWYAPLNGYGEVREFQKKMAAKMGDMLGAGMRQLAMMNGGQANIGKGMEEVAKEMQKIDGVPVESVVRMAPSAGSSQAPAPSTAETCSSEPQTSAKPSSSESSSSAIAGALAGRFGGFGKRKKDEEQPAPAASNAQGCAAGAGPLMEMTMTLTSFSPAPVDASKFDVPAGYKLVDSRR